MHTHKQEFEREIKDYPDMKRYDGAFTEKESKDFDFFMNRYKNFETIYNDKKYQSKTFRRARMLNNMIFLFNKMFKQEFPKYQLKERQLISEHKYFSEDTYERVKI